MSNKRCCAGPLARLDAVSRWIVVPIFSVIFIFLTCANAAATALVPCVRWGTTAVAFYRQPAFAPGGLLFYLVQLLLGYFFCTLIINRSDAFFTRWGEKAAALGLAFSALYGLGVLFTLNGDCSSTTDLAAMEWAVLYRGIGFGLPHCLGLHWTFMDSIPGLNAITLSARYIRAWGSRQWSTVAFVISLISVGVAYNLYLLHSIGRLWWYLLALAATVMAFVLAGWLLSATHHTHFHHYGMAAFAIWFIVAESPFSAAAQAAFIGVGQEGICRWGPDPCFIPMSQDELAHNRRRRDEAAALRSCRHSGGGGKINPLITAESDVAAADAGAASQPVASTLAAFS